MAASEPVLPPHSEDVEEELQRIQLALSAVFTTSGVSIPVATQHEWWTQRHLADRYLTSFQSTSVSWMVCDRLLQQPDGGNDAVQRRFFAAQTLHTKCRSDVHELPEAVLPSLRDSLLVHLNRSSLTGESALTTRLAMCVSSLAVQMRWTTIVDDLLANTTNVKAIMNVLGVLPEECASDRLLLVDENLRFAMRDHLVSISPKVFNFLQASADHALVLRVFHTWVRYVPVHPQVLADSALLSASVQALTQEPYLELAADVVVEVLRMYPSHLFTNEGLVKLMIPLLTQLPLDQALQSDDEDVWRAYCRVVTEMGESYMSVILSHHHQQASKLVEWVLKCSAISESEISSITLHFWYKMAMDLEATEPYDWRQELVDGFTPHLLKLIDVAVSNLMRYPSDLDEISEDRIEDLHRHRFYVGETVADCCRLLGGDSVMQTIGKALEAEIQRLAGSQLTDWHGIESCFACIEAIHPFIPSDEAKFLPLCFQSIPQLPPTVLPLRFTASKLIGKYASWLAQHADHLQPLMPYLAEGLTIPECAPAAAVAIKELCGCSNQNFKMAEPVVRLYEDLASQPGRLELPDELQILEGVCRALTRQIMDTRDDGTSFLTHLAQPIGNRLAATVSDPNSSPRRIIPDIERLTVIVQFLKLPDTRPMVNLVRSSLSWLDGAASRFPGDVMLAEKICRLHKHSMRNCGAVAFEPVLDALIEHLTKTFERSHQSPFLYAASICITEYGNNPAFAQRLNTMISTIASTVFSFLRNLEEMKNHPDVVEEFFYLMGRMMSHCPDSLVMSPLLQSLFECAVVAMQLDHPGANKGTLKFIENTISYGLALRERNKQDCQAALEHVLSRAGGTIVANLARAMMGDLPAYSNQIPEILWKLNLLCPGLLNQWLTSAFNAAPLPDRAKSDLLGALDTGLARDEFSSAVRAFQAACNRQRRFRNNAPTNRAQ